MDGARLAPLPRLRAGLPAKCQRTHHRTGIPAVEFRFQKGTKTLNTDFDKDLIETPPND